MSITTRCAGCQKVYKLDDKFAGKKVRCKSCGGVMTIPELAEDLSFRDDAAPAVRPAAKKPTPSARPAAAPAASEDPFENLDSLLSLEQTGMVQDAPPLVRGRGAPPPPPPRAAPMEVDDKVAPAPARPVTKDRRGRPIGVQPAPELPAYTGLSDAQFSFRGEDAVFRLVAVIAVAAFVLPGAMIIWATYSDVSAAAKTLNATINPERWSLFLWSALRFFYFVPAGFSVAISALSMLGVYIASQVMKFEMPENAFLSCVIASLLLLDVHLVHAAIVTRPHGDLPALLCAFNLLGFLAMLGGLWVLLRLRIVPFAVSAGCVTGCGILLPVLFVVMLGAMHVQAESVFGYESWNSRVERRLQLERERMNKKGDEMMRQLQSGQPPRPNPIVGPRDLASDRRVNQQRLATIYTALHKYAAAHGNRFPTTIDEAFRDAGMDIQSGVPVEGGRFTYMPITSPLKAPLPADLVVAHEELPKGPDMGRLIVFGDGRIEVVHMERWNQIMLASRKLRSGSPP